MPTHYFTVTTDTAIKLVSSKKYKEIEEYIEGTLQTDEKFRDFNRYGEWFKLSEVPFQQRLYHIMITATEYKALDVLEGIQRWITPESIEYHLKDGNVYSSLQLAAEIMSTDTDTRVYEFFVKIFKDSGDTKEWYTRYLVKNNPNFDLIDKVIQLTDCSLWNMYHYSIAWNKPGLTEYLVNNYRYKIDMDWNKDAFEIARRFESEDSLKLLREKPWLFNMKRKRIK